MPLLERITFKDIDIYHYDVVESTSDLIRDFDDYLGKIVIWADQQTKGRGRKKRDWESPLGGLWLTLSFSPTDFPREYLPYIVRLPALSLIYLLSSKGIHPRVKPPNDIHVEGKKIAGILIDTKIKDNYIERIYIGIGINVNNSTKKFPSEISQITTSMYDLTLKTYDLRLLLFEFLDNIFELFDDLFRDKNKIDKLWHKYLIK